MIFVKMTLMMRTIMRVKMVIMIIMISESDQVGNLNANIIL